MSPLPHCQIPLLEDGTRALDVLQGDWKIIFSVKRLTLKKLYFVLFGAAVPESLVHERLTDTNLMNKEIVEVCKDQFLLWEFKYSAV